MKIATLHLIVLLLVFAPSIEGTIPKDYKGKPFRDATHTTGPQVIPGRLEAALYDLAAKASPTTTPIRSTTAPES